METIHTIIFYEKRGQSITFISFDKIPLFNTVVSFDFLYFQRSKLGPHQHVGIKKKPHYTQKSRYSLRVMNREKSFYCDNQSCN